MTAWLLVHGKRSGHSNKVFVSSVWSCRWFPLWRPAVLSTSSAATITFFLAVFAILSNCFTSPASCHLANALSGCWKKLKLLWLKNACCHVIAILLISWSAKCLNWSFTTIVSRNKLPATVETYKFSFHFLIGDIFLLELLSYLIPPPSSKEGGGGPCLGCNTSKRFSL